MNPFKGRYFQETRVEPVRASSPSWFVARINAVSRIIVVSP